MAYLFCKHVVFSRIRDITITNNSPFPIPIPIPIQSTQLVTHHTTPSIHNISLLRRRFSTNMSDPNATENMKTVRVEVKGVVQGVFFRDWTVENATRLGLDGWVRNRRDGSVEILLSGNSNKVDEMQQRCRRGPDSAVVTSFQSFPSADDPGVGFQRRPIV